MRIGKYFYSGLLCACTLLPLSSVSCKQRNFSETESITSGVRPPELTPEKLLPMNLAMQRHVDRGRLHGAVTLVVQNGRVIQQKAYGKMDIERNIPMREDAIFRLASSTKLISAVAFLTLLDQGRIRSLDDAVSQYLPGFHVNVVTNPKAPKSEWKIVPAIREPSIRDVLRHTAGFQYGFGLNEIDKEYELAGLPHWDRPLSEFVRTITSIPVAYQPGSQFSYSYSNDFMAAIGERITGKPWNVFVKEALLKPLGMVDTDFFVPPEKVNRLSGFYESVNGQMVLREAASTSPFLALPKALSSGGGWQTGYGGMVSTARDYGRLLQMLLNRGELDGVRILSPQIVQELITDQIRHIPPQAGARFPPDLDHAGRGFGLGSGVETEGDDPSRPTIFWSGFPYNVMFFADFSLNLYSIMFTQSAPYETEFQPGGIKPEFRDLVKRAALER